MIRVGRHMLVLMGSGGTCGDLAKRLPGEQDGRGTAWRPNNQCRMNTNWSGINRRLVEIGLKAKTKV